MNISDRVSFMVASDGMLFKKKENQAWEPFNFNEIYAGFYDSCEFSAIAFCGTRFILAGINKTGRTRIFESAFGEVWKLSVVDAESKINCICWHEESKQAFLFGTGGICITLSACGKCTVVKRITAYDITAAEISESSRNIILEITGGTRLSVPLSDLSQTHI